MPDKTLVIIVSRNNPTLLQHTIKSHIKYPPGIPCDYCIVDSNSDDKAQLRVLDEQSLAEVCHYENDRVEVNFQLCWRNHPGYNSYFFTHDDNVPYCNNWLVPFVDKLKNNFAELEIRHTYLENIPLGRVGALGHFWSDYETVAGYPIQKIFLRECVKEMYGEAHCPPFIKYLDCDRVLISSDCLKATNGLVTLNTFKDNEKVLEILDRFLYYYDTGMYPLSKYPPGKHWNRLTLLSEFMNSVLPLIHGYRSTCVDGDYLEERDGYDSPVGHRYIAHYGAPNALEALAKKFGSNPQMVKSFMNNSRFLINCQEFFQEHYGFSSPLLK